MSIEVIVRSLNGEVKVELPDGATAEQVREAANLAQGVNLRSGGESLSDSTPVTNGQTLVATPPEAKHGVTA